MNTSRKGAKFEREIRKVFENQGFSVIRGAASKGVLFGVAVDLVATKLTAENEYTAYLTIVGVQCKAKRVATK